MKIEIRRILCPVDFSEFSRRALDHAVAIARWYEATVTAVHVYSMAPIAAYGPGPVVIEPVVLASVDRAQLLAELTSFVKSEFAAGVPMQAVIREGHAAKEILDQATSMNADLLVMGTHGRSGFERLLLGSVTEKVLRKASCPVLTVPRRLPDAVPAGPVLFKEILCAVDFSDCSMDALDYAASLAQEADGRLTIVHVLSSLEPDASVAGQYSTFAALQAEREEDARQRLDRAVPGPVAEYCRVEPMVVHGKPSQEILRITSERQADLIVMGVQGRGAADRMFFGSTTQHVVREATCPVLTIRRP